MLLGARALSVDGSYRVRGTFRSLVQSVSMGLSAPSDLACEARTSGRTREMMITCDQFKNK